MNFLAFFDLVNFFIISLAFFLIVFAVVLNFLFSQEKEKAKKEKKGWIETGSMFAFFIIFYLVIRLKVGELNLDNYLIRIPIIFFSWIVILIGVYFNISGRILLGKNWANQIIIYKNQTFVKKGVYSIVRHPLYASLIWIFYACSLIYLNWLAFLLNSLVFVPMMYHRAKIEEKELSKEFKNYKKYQKEVGMFFPRLGFFLKQVKKERNCNIKKATNE